MEEIRNIAKSLGINPGKFPKAELIKCIQTDDGNFDCFATVRSGECDQPVCLWREDCFKAASS